MGATPVDPAADRPVFRQVADDLRQRIQGGEFRPGQKLPSEPHLMDQYGVGRNTLRQALSVLRGEGLVETVPRIGNRVRQEQTRTVLPAGPGAVVRARMPTEIERSRLGLPLGVPVLVLTQPDGNQQLLPADRFAVVFGDEQ